MNRRQFAGLALISLAAACSGDSPTSPKADISGTYTLRTVNGSAVPFTLGPTQTGMLSIFAGNVTVNANGSFSSSSTVRETVGTTSTNTTESSSGTWILSGSTVSFKDGVDGTTTTAQYAADSLTLVESGLTYVYRK